MSELKKLGQWFAWFFGVMVLLLMTCFYSLPIIAYLLRVQLPPDLAVLSGWELVVASVGSWFTTIWWLGRGQEYTGRA